MADTPTIPITVPTDAAARVAELGLQREFQQMLDHALRTIPGLQSLQVELALPYDTDEDTSITIWATREKPDAQRLLVEDQWDQWVLGTYHPDVWSRMRLITVYENPR
jgi:hypothetical protein